jgi:hypothetical protein
MSTPTYAPINAVSSYLPEEFQFPVDATPEKMRELISKQNRMISSIVNVKENANYEQRELLSAQQWFSSINNGAIVTSYGFRLAFDLVALNGGSIPNGTTTISLPTNPANGTPITISYADGLIPLHGFGAATIGTTYYFVNDPDIYVRFTNTSTTVQSVTVVNSTGSAITQFYWVFEYLKT